MTDEPRAPTSNPGYARLVLAMLLIVYTFNWLDRQILGILAPAIKADLGLTNTQLGALGGIAFAMLYSTVAIPLAVVADRTSRSWVITASLVVWSGFTALCGLAGGFWHLFLCRLGVGVGEAGGVAPSYALISRYFPPEQRARAISIYSMGIPVGLAAGVLFGAAIAKAVDWRAAFVVIGLAGVVIAPIFRLVVKEPPSLATPAGAAPLERGVRGPGPQAQLLADGVRFGGQQHGGLRPGLLGALDPDPGLRFRPGHHLVFLRLAAVGRRRHRRLSGRRAGRQAGQGRIAAPTPGSPPSPGWSPRPCSSPACCRRRLIVAWLFLLIPNALNILFVGPLTTGRPAPGARPHARHRGGVLPVHQQPDRHRRRLVAAGRDQRRHEAPVRRRRAALFGGATGEPLLGRLALALLAIKPLRKDWVEEPAA